MVQQRQALATKTGARVQSLGPTRFWKNTGSLRLSSNIYIARSLSVCLCPHPLALKQEAKKAKIPAFFEMTEAMALAIAALHSNDGKKPDFR